MSKRRTMHYQGQGLLSYFYPGFVLILGPYIRSAFTGPLVLWFHGPLVMPYILKTIQIRNIFVFYFVIV